MDALVGVALKVSRLLHALIRLNDLSLVRYGWDMCVHRNLHALDCFPYT